MHKIFLFSILFFFALVSTNAQEKLNNYSAILIPTKFKFQDEPHEYNINNILKASLKNYDFKTFILGEDNDEIEKLKIDRCDILTLKIKSTGGAFTTKINLVFYDCFDKMIHTSILGKSRIKDFKGGYYQAIRRALKDVNIQKHTYQKSK